MQTGLPDFSWYNIPKQEKYPKLPKIPSGHKIGISNGRKMDQMVICMYKMPTPSIARPS
jgi:hypothetical protein